MWIEIQSGSKSLNRCDRTTLGTLHTMMDTGAAALVRKECSHERAQHFTRELRIPGAAISQGIGQCQDPLSHRHFRQHMIDEVRCSVGHAPSPARGTQSSAFAAER
jgi:hypothetical protein